MRRRLWSPPPGRPHALASPLSLNWCHFNPVAESSRDYLYDEATCTCLFIVYKQAATCLWWPHAPHRSAAWRKQTALSLMKTRLALRLCHRWLFPGEGADGGSPGSSCSVVSPHCLCRLPGKQEVLFTATLPRVSQRRPLKTQHKHFKASSKTHKTLFHTHYALFF
jgi:hypothetical protein